MIKIGGGAGVVTPLKRPPPRGHSITKHMGGGLARRSESKTPNYLSKNSNIKKKCQNQTPKYS